MQNDLDFDLNIVNEKVSLVDNRQENQDIVVDVHLFVSWLEFIGIKYGIRSLEDLNSHDELGIITSQWIGAVDIESRLRSQQQITSQIDEEMESRIKSSKTYVDYTNESGTIVLTIEKLFQVCSRIFKDFKLGKKDFVTVVSYTWESRDVADQSIQELIRTVQEIYLLRNKKMVMEGNCTTYHEITFNLLVKRYGKDNLPVHMNKLRLQFLKDHEMFDIPPCIIGSRAVGILVAAITDEDTKKVEVDKDNNNIVRVDVSLGTSIMHEFDRQISKQLTVYPETVSMVNTLIEFKVVPKDEQDKLVKYFMETANETDLKLKTESIDLDYSVLNVGWLTLPKNPKNNIENSQKDFATNMISRLKTEDHFYLYCPITYDYIRIRHPSGIKVPNPQFLAGILRSLTKFFHFMNQICSFYNKDPERVKGLVTEMIGHFAQNFCPQPEHRNRFKLLFTLNYKVWIRAVEITSFGDIRDVYLPSSTMGYNEKYEDLEEELVIDI